MCPIVSKLISILFFLVSKLNVIKIYILILDYSSIILIAFRSESSGVEWAREKKAETGPRSASSKVWWFEVGMWTNTSPPPRADTIFIAIHSRNEFTSLIKFKVNLLFLDWFFISRHGSHGWRDWKIFLLPVDSTTGHRSAGVSRNKLTLEYFRAHKQIRVKRVEIRVNVCFGVYCSKHNKSSD